MLTVQRFKDQTPTVPLQSVVEILDAIHARITLTDPATVQPEVQFGEDTSYCAIKYVAEWPYRPGLAEDVHNNFDAWLDKFKAVNLAQTAEAIREKRNALLAASDKAMAFDRFGLDVPSGSTFSAWVAFFRGLGQALTNHWAAYRQALRDLTTNPKFPYLDEDDWPQEPEE